MSTVDALATKALHDDFAVAKYQTAARDAIKTAIGMIYSTTDLARGDYTPAALTYPKAAVGVLLTETGLHVRSVTMVDTGDELDESDVDTIAAEQQRTGAAPGRPVIYALTGAGLTVEGMTLVLAPIPDKDYKLQLVGTFAPADGDLDPTDPVPVPSRYEDMLVEYGRSVLFGLEGDPTMSDFHLGRFNGRLTQLKGDLGVRSLKSRRTPGTWSGVASGPRFHHPKGLF